ncbi:PAS domain-containing hybrid sensor histidine kinase/response regulator [Kushneria phyllosphaerae]|uniref:Sensory/regulatory protein RpfC n=1 Tax=Kushneria phyllosphaerae TaxID=2100822 RepID=A0A2R8CJ25_9GAMM|nr:CHASE domain-containing protein [Kushneria phyllosphaerae]SPJ32886.1 Signal transduction histidine-protein kinase BarA [Kushneria phyllosphaerae]
MQINKKASSLYTNRWAILSLIAGVMLSVAASIATANFNHQQAEQAAIAAAEKTADAVLSRLKLYEYGLRGARGAIQSMGEGGISREHFDSYSRTRDVDKEFPGARGFGFIRRVARQDEASFLARARADGWPDFTIRELAPHDAERYVIEYISEVERNRAAVGLDIASEANRRQAALSAMRSGEVRLSGPITLVQATGLPQQSFLILMPIYRGGVTPETVAAREAQAFGWSYAPLITDEVLDSLNTRERAISLTLSDTTDPTDRVEFYHSIDEASREVVFSHTTERDVFGRHWQLQFDVHPLFVDQLRQLSPWLVLSIGLMLTGLLSCLLGLLNISRTRQVQVISEQKKLAAIVESSVDGIIGKDLDGTVTSWNKGAEVLFGFSTEEAIGRRLVDLMVPEDQQTEEAEILATICDGRPVSGLNTLRQHKNRQLIPVSITASPILDSSGKIVGVSKTVRDISQQVEAEKRIHELNSNLEAQVADRTERLHGLNQLLGNVLHSASEVAIIATDRDGLIRIFNTGAERMLGYNAADLVDRGNLIDFHLREEIAIHSRELMSETGRVMEGLQVLVYKAELNDAETREWTYVRKDGSTLPVSVVITAMRDEQGICTGYLGIAIDLTSRKASEAALVLARDQLLMAAEAAELGIWSWTPADNALTWNDRMFDIFAWPLELRRAGVTYEHWRSRVHPDDIERVENMLERTITQGARFDPVFRVVRPDGSECFVQAGAHIERDAMGVTLRVTGINRDITAQRELESRLLYAKEQADASSAAKSNFLANMSHEIRTPMNAVLGMLHLVQNTELSTRQLDYVSKAEIAAKSLLSLLNDILDYSKIEAGKLLLDEHAFELEPLMRDLAVVLSGNQGDKSVEVLFDLDPQLPCTLIGDSQRLQQVLINLAGNALKFTHTGQVIVRVKKLQRRGEALQVRIEVTDTGIGISPDQLTRIFDSFTQAEASTTRRFGGTGLGLVISRRLINLMGSELQVSSEIGVGSRFWFDLELAMTEITPLRVSCPGADRPMRLLVADDNEVAGLLQVHMVQALGWQADLVHNGLQAVERAQQMQQAGKSYDVILMDWKMPTMDGLSAASLIRQQSPAQHSPMIIMITAYGREVLSDARQEGEVPFAGFLSKPITPLQLASTIHGLLDENQAPEPSVASRRAAQPRRLAGLRLLVVEDNMLNRQVAFELLQGEGAQVTLAEGGIEGVQQATSNAEAFDAVLMDIQMPDIDGLEATRRIRLDAARGSVKIIAMTANASSSDEKACLAAGMNDHLGKPIDLEKMVATLLRHTGRASVDPVVVQTPAASQDSVLEPIDAIDRRFGGNRELIRNVLSSFAQDQKKQLVLLQDHMAQYDATGAAFVLHAIKGGSANMGARSLSQMAGELEHRLRHDDDASVKALLADTSLIEELTSVLRTSVERLKEAFDLPPGQPSPAGADSLPSAQWKEAMKMILQLLKDGNMQAIEQSEALQTRTPQALKPGFDAFVDLVRSLDFAASIPAGQKLLDSA